MVNGFKSYGNQFDGLACYSTEDSRFSNLDLHDNLGAGISLDLDFNHNVIDGATLTDNDLGVFMRQSRNNTFAGLKINKSHHHGVFMAQTVDGKRLCPGTECIGNSFEKMLVTNCGGRAFLVNDASCISNSITSSQFVGNAQGGLEPSAGKACDGAGFGGAGTSGDQRDVRAKGLAECSGDDVQAVLNGKRDARKLQRSLTGSIT